MTQLIAPVWAEAPLSVQRWMERVTEIVTGRIEGGEAVLAKQADVSEVATVADSATQAAQAAQETADAKADAETVSGQQASLNDIRQQLGLTASNEALEDLLARIETLEATP